MLSVILSVIYFVCLSALLTVAVGSFASVSFLTMFAAVVSAYFIAVGVIALRYLDKLIRQ